MPNEVRGMYTWVSKVFRRQNVRGKIRRTCRQQVIRWNVSSLPIYPNCLISTNCSCKCSHGILVDHKAVKTSSHLQHNAFLSTVVLANIKRERKQNKSQSIIYWSRQTFQILSGICFGISWQISFRYFPFHIYRSSGCLFCNIVNVLYLTKTISGNVKNCVTTFD